MLMMCFSLLVILVIHEATAACPTSSNVITIKDIQNAALASKHVYDDGLVEGSTIPQTSFKVIKRFHDELLDGGEGIRTIVAESGNTVIIAYRGTDGFEQLLAQADSGLFGAKKEWTIDGTKMEILSFFYQAFKLSRYAIRPYINKPDKKYIITGHSLGGAMASLLALEGTQIFSGSIWKNPRSSLITFGQPRVGNSAYANVHDRLISTFRKIRFVYKNDPVARIPLSTWWKHHSTVVYIGTEYVYTGFNWGRKKRSLVADRFRYSDMGNYHQNSKRVLWGSRPYWQVCQEKEDFACTGRLIIPNTNDHYIDAYVNSVMSPPSRMKTKRGTLKSHFEEAYICTCYNQRR